MPIDLTRFEQGAPFAGDYGAALSAFQERLAGLQLAQIVHRRRAIILIEGWEGAGKRGALKQLAGALDPCHFTTHCVDRHGAEQDERHWLARFWSRLPAAGHSVIFYRSWYRLMVEARLSGELDDKGWARAADEINEFEAQQRDHGTLLVKLFFHLGRDEQDRRLRERRADPWQRVLLGPGEPASLTHRPEHEAAWVEVFDQTDTRWAPWALIDASDKRAGRIAALSAIADAFGKAMPSEPPAAGDKVVYLDTQKRA